MTLSAWIVVVFLLCFAAELTLETGLALLNLRHTAARGAAVPPPLRGHLTDEAAARSRDYALARGRFALGYRLAGATLTLALLFSGFLPWLDAAVAGSGLLGAKRFVSYLLVLGAVPWLFGLPFALYSTFRIEARFGFNRMTLRMWLADRAKALSLGAALGLPLLFAAYGFIAYAGDAWWVWLFCLLAVYQLLLVWLYPTLIAPLFNRFTPLPPGGLRTRVQALAERAGFRPRGLYVMDASRRSGHSNAYFVGFWRPRIVLFDTLLERVSTEEALAVLAHEMGHYRARHIHKSLALNLVLWLAGLYVLSVLLHWAPLYAAFGFAAPSAHAALALLMLGGGAFTFWLQPLAAWVSRRHEFEADAYAVRMTEGPQAMGSALVQLNAHNLSNLAPHPWFARYHYSHPTLLERLAALAPRAPAGSEPSVAAP